MCFVFDINENQSVFLKNQLTMRILNHIPGPFLELSLQVVISIIVSFYVFCNCTSSSSNFVSLLWPSLDARFVNKLRYV